MNAITRPEYYVLPVKHPANCRCSGHEPNVSCRTTGGTSPTAAASSHVALRCFSFPIFAKFSKVI